MSEPPQQRQRLRKPVTIIGTSLALALGLSLLYAVLGSKFTLGAGSNLFGAWSDALCASAMLLAIGSAVPFLFDVGRGVTMPIKLGISGAERTPEATTKALREEHRKREKGMSVTFALAISAALVATISIVLSFL